MRPEDPPSALRHSFVELPQERLGVLDEGRDKGAQKTDIDDVVEVYQHVPDFGDPRNSIGEELVKAPHNPQVPKRSQARVGASAVCFTVTKFPYGRKT